MKKIATDLILFMNFQLEALPLHSEKESYYLNRNLCYTPNIWFLKNTINIFKLCIIGTDKHQLFIFLKRPLILNC